MSDIFQGESDLLMKTIDVLINEIKPQAYHFIANNRYRDILSINIEEANRIYWTENFNRVHFGGQLSLVKTQRWTEAVSESKQNKNYLSFCSSLRGLVESSADTYYSFHRIPFFLNQHFKELEKIFNAGLSDHLMIAKDFEESVIHFTHASGKIFKDLKVKEFQKAKTMKEYIEKLDEMSDGPIYKLYGQLCEITHPAGPSLWSYMGYKSTSEKDTIVVLAKRDSDELQINRLIDENKASLNKILAGGVFPVFAALKVLNQFGLKEFTTGTLDQIDFNQFGFWRQIMKMDV